MPASAAGSAEMMRNGIEPGLEVDDDEQVDEQDGEGQAGEQADVGLVHGFALAAQDEVGAAGQTPSRGRAMIFSMARVTVPRSVPSTLA